MGLAACTSPLSRLNTPCQPTQTSHCPAPLLLQTLVSGPKLKKAVASLTDDLSLDDYSEFDALESGDYIDSDVQVTVAGGDDYESWSGNESDLGTYFDR